MIARTLLPVCMVAATLASVLGPPDASAEGLQTAAITDAGGFAEPMTAATVEIPASWRSQGGVTWNQATNCVNNKVRIEWRARSRDDLQGFEIMPGYSWQVAGTQIQMNPCPAQPFRSARAFLEAVVQQRRAGARVLQYRDRPDLAAASGLLGGRQANPQIQRRIDAGQLLIAYESGGVDFREVLGTVVNFTELRGNVVAGAMMIFAQRAPHGQLDFAEADRMAGSFRYQQAWGEKSMASLRSSERRFSTSQSQAIAQGHARERARINAEGAADRAAIRASANRDVARINAQTQANTAATNDRIHRRTMESVTETNTWRDADGTQVRSSIHGGDRVLRGANGGVMSTNDPYFNPAGSRELQRVR